MSLKRARWYAYRYRVEVGDLAQEALIGAWQAYGKYDASRGMSLSSYLWKRADWAIKRHLRNEYMRSQRFVSFEDVEQVKFSST